VKAGVLGFTTLVGGRLAGSVSLARGVDLLGATRAGDPLASRNDADATFTTLSLSADWSRTIVDGLGVKLGVRVQRASQPLLLAEEIGIGGATFGRGYDYSERSGDQGVMGYAELAYKWDKRVGPLNGIEVYGFADGGKVTNLGSGFGGGTLYSSGAGVRADVDRRTDATFEVAVPLSGPRYESDDERARLRFSLSRYF
jgi:hemolysin activation/secretion protein